MSCLEKLALSPVQEAAVLDAGPRTLVAAGAGSGKTSLLVACFLRALLDEGVPVERLVAVTFTRKAAAELTVRIRQKLKACGRPDLARSLDSAIIGTIHGLCRRLLKEHALEAGVDPACTVLEADAALLLKEEACRAAWGRVIEQVDDVALEVIASRGQALRREIVTLYDRLRGMGVERPLVVVSPAPGGEDARVEAAAAIRTALAAAESVERPTASLQADLVRLRTGLDWLGRTAPPYSLEDVDAALEATTGFFPSRRTPSLEPHFAPSRDALTRYRCVLAEERLRPLVRVVNDLLSEFHRQYEVRKRERGLLDFADLELRARMLVLGAAGDAAPAPLLPGARVLIDEFQDTNELQCSILEGLGASRLLMVGDERQSIYRFRGADVALFRRREAELDARGTEAPGGRVHRLDANYRSGPEILAFLNRLFSQEGFFGSRFVPLEEPERGSGSAGGTGRATTDPGARGSPGDRAARQSPGVHATGPAPAGPAVEILVAARRGDDPDTAALALEEAESEAVADRIRRLIDDEGWEQREIVVLLPAQTHVQRYRQALLARGVEVYVVRGKGYYSQEEVADVTSLLKLLVNPHDDVALLTALRSPLAGVSDDGLYLLGRERHGRRASLWRTVQTMPPDVLSGDDQAELNSFVRRLTDLRRRVGRPGLARLIDDAITACDYDICLLASLDGKRRFANVRKLMRMADDFESLRGPDLAGFLELVGSLGGLNDTEGSAPTLAEGEDVVRVMTVHQAKGLEFPVVVLAGLGSNVPKPNLPEVVVGQDGRMGVFLKGSKRGTYECDDLCWGPAAEIVADDRSKEQEEDVRMLYVAMTRPQRRLILVGAAYPDDKLGSCRIGRILAGLGFDRFPNGGEELPLEGLRAVVAGVGPSSVDAASARPQVRSHVGMAASAGEAAGGAACDALPQFMQATSRSILPRTVSFSALASYQRCPRRFFLERVLGLGVWVDDGAEHEGGEEQEDGRPPATEPPLDDEERNAGREVGLLVHALLESIASADGPPPDEVVRNAAREWLRETGIRLDRGSLDRAAALTRAFWDSPVACLRDDPTAQREAQFLFALGELMVAGVMDLVTTGAPCWRIVDYKTNALGGRAPAELASEYRLQATVYCLAALRAGAPAVQFDLVFLERPEAPVTTRSVQDEASQLENELAQAFDGLKRGEFPAGPAEECVVCALRTVCSSMTRP